MTKPSITACPIYLDPKGALAFLEAAFGFELDVLVLGEGDEVVHAEMRFGDGKIEVGAAWSDRIASPKVLGKASASIHVQLADGIDAHCERARAAGAEILREPATQPYGDRTYVAADPEGNLWSFGQTVDAAARSAWDQPGSVTRHGAS
jgi:uncharacterized glyoxalase superfamily protein PhnB